MVLEQVMVDDAVDGSLWWHLLFDADTLFNLPKRVLLVIVLLRRHRKDASYTA